WTSTGNVVLWTVGISITSQTVTKNLRKNTNFISPLRIPSAQIILLKNSLIFSGFERYNNQSPLARSTVSGTVLFSPEGSILVPVVFGGGDYSAVSPPHSYINVRKFPNAKSLAEYLLYLDSNDTAYMEYFK
ncbi:hypothetical protein Avbf_05653, partial [Armadillidium vulgare]